jgi:hypothetical protein
MASSSASLRPRNLLSTGNLIADRRLSAHLFPLLVSRSSCRKTRISATAAQSRQPPSAAPAKWLYTGLLNWTSLSAELHLSSESDRVLLSAAARQPIRHSRKRR